MEWGQSTKLSLHRLRSVGYSDLVLLRFISQKVFVKFKPEFSLGSASTGRREALDLVELQNPLPERRGAQQEIAKLPHRMQRLCSHHGLVKPGTTSPSLVILSLLV